MSRRHWPTLTGGRQPVVRILAMGNGVRDVHGDPSPGLWEQAATTTQGNLLRLRSVLRHVLDLGSAKVRLMPPLTQEMLNMLLQFALII